MHVIKFYILLCLCTQIDLFTRIFCTRIWIFYSLNEVILHLGLSLIICKIKLQFQIKVYVFIVCMVGNDDKEWLQQLLLSSVYRTFSVHVFYHHSTCCCLSLT